MRGSARGPLLGGGTAAALAVVLAAWAASNSAPTITGANGLDVRPDRSVTVSLSATDADTDPQDAKRSESVRLQATAPSGAPAWLDDSDWSVPAAQNPTLSFDIAAPETASPASYTITAMATDQRGLSATSQFELRVLGPLCTVALEIDEDGTCTACADHHLPNVSKTRCLACPVDTERSGTAKSCAACPAGKLSRGGAACAANAAPTADAGRNRSVEANKRATLDGSGSSDPEGRTLTYAWEQREGPTVTLSDAAAATPSFTAPAVTAGTVLRFRLTVTDPQGLSDFDQIRITVTPPANARPVADAGDPQTVDEGRTVTLDGTSSSDADTDELTYAWTAPAGVTLSDASAAKPTFAAPNRVSTYTLTFSLTVNDGAVDSAPDTVAITVNAVNNDPKARAGSDQSVIAGRLATLAGGGTDPEGETLTYAWEQRRGKPKVELANASSATATFTAPAVDAEKTLTFRLTVTDPRGATDGDSVRVTVAPATNAAPRANAGSDQRAEEGATVTLDGSASSDPDDDPLTYAWTAPAGVTLSSAAAEMPTFTAPNRAADYSLTFGLTVNDGTVDSEADTVVVAVSADNDAPTAYSGDDQEVVSGDRVTLAGRGTDPEGETLTYWWEQRRGETLALENAGTATATFTAPTVAAETVLRFRLTVRDPHGARHRDSVDITVAPSNLPPVANAGSNRRVEEEASVTLDGTASSDPDDDELTYLWTAPDGVSLSSATAASPTFTAPNRAADYQLTFSLKVNDGELDSYPDTVVISVTADDDAPTASAGPNRTVDAGQSVTLSGGGDDPEGATPAYRWTQRGGPTVELDGAAKAAATFTAPQVTRRKALTFRLRVTDPGGNKGRDDVRVRVEPAGNRAPAADAGSPQSVDEGDLVSLDGSGSSDPDDDPLTHAWTAPAGVTLSDAAVASPSFTAPNRTADYTLEFSLTVNDGTVDSPAATVAVSVTADDDAPTAEAGPDQKVLEGATVTLAGSGTDPEGAALTYAWTQTAGTSVVLSSAKVSDPTFIAPDVTEDAALTFSLTVSDGTNSSAADTVTVTVRSDNRRPTADAGSPQSVDEDDLVTLDGSGSTDPDNDPLTYAWTAPAGVTLSDADASKPTFSAPNRTADYSLEFSLTVNDTIVDSVADSVTVSVRADNDAPTADAGPDQKVLEGATVVLGGSGADPEDESLTFAWTQTAGTSVVLSSAKVSGPTFTAPNVTEDAALTFSLTVSDGTNTSAADRVTVTVRADNGPPVADAGSPQTVDEGDLVTLDGSVSSDPDNDALTYAWTQAAGPAVALSSATVAGPTFTAPNRTAGYTLTFSLTVNDNAVDSPADTVTVTVRADNDAPAAEAGPDQKVLEGATVTLSGSGSDPEGESLTYAWTQAAGPAVALSNAEVAGPTFAAPEVTQDTALTFSLTVSDGTNASAADTVTVTVASTDCPITTRGKCELPATDDGGTAGACKAGADGSCSYRCSAGTWIKENNTCVDCGTAVNSCDPGTPTKKSSTPKTDGACATTEVRRCVAGDFDDKTDRTAENGACGASKNTCSPGDPTNERETPRKFLWDCLGIDGAKLWQCDGIDGVDNWSCRSGSAAKQCSATDPAGDDSCSETIGATDASDCEVCKPCTGANEVLGADCDCVCAAGHHRHNGKCVENPVCGPLTCADGACDDWSDNDNGSCKRSSHYGDVGDTVESFKWQCSNGGQTLSCVADRPGETPGCPQSTEGGCDLPRTDHGETAGACKAGADGSCSYRCSAGTWIKENNTCVDCGTAVNSCDPGTPTKKSSTPKTDGACATTEARRCAAGDFDDKTDRAAKNGACGSAKNECEPGVSTNHRETPRKFLWDCLGIDGAKLWQCDGIDGVDNWSCRSGSAAKQCSATDPAGDDSCSETIGATDASDCEVCKPCTGANEVLGADCDCVCATGHHRHNGKCVENPVCGPLTCADGACDDWSDNDNGSCGKGAYTDQSDTDGQFKWQCSNGNMTVPCSGNRPTVANCDSSSVSWTVGSRTCTASRPETKHAATAEVEDSTVNSANPNTGSVRYTCTDGKWGSETGATCGCGDECLCILAGNTWMDAQPERPNTCTGNAACLPGSHRHSCTTPKDPNGGYSSCEYKRHRGGIYCASHRTETCNPIPAVPAHCHHDPVCEICCEFGENEYCQ